MPRERQTVRAGRARDPDAGAEPMGERWLALETATRAMGIALYEGGHLRAELCEDVSGKHAEALLPALERMLSSVAWTPASLDGVALSIGPGSFTGLRVGLATVKGMAFGGTLPVVPVSTLAGLAALADGARPIAAFLDARRDEVYAAVWNDDLTVPPSLGESVYGAAELIERLPEGCRIVVGEGSRAVADVVLAERPDMAATPVGEVRARADAIGRLAANALRSREGQPADLLVPRYVRRAEAEVQRTGVALEG